MLGDACEKEEENGRHSGCPEAWGQLWQETGHVSGVRSMGRWAVRRWATEKRHTYPFPLWGLSQEQRGREEELSPSADPLPSRDAGSSRAD